MSPTFNYQVRNRDGETEEGKLQASSREDAARQLKKEGYFISSLNKTEAEKDRERFWEKEIDFSVLAFWQSGLKTGELAQFSEQFSVLISAGISLVESLNIIKEQTQKGKFKKVLDEVISDIEGGGAFSEALSEHPKYFPPFFCQLVKAGETGGILDEVLQELADHYRRQHEIKEEVKSALYYPITILMVGIAAIIFLLTFVVPQIAEIFETLDVELPLPTVILISTSEFMQNYWWLVMGGLILLGLMAVLVYRSPRGQFVMDRLILKLPIVGTLILKLGVARFSSTLALLLDSGVTLLSALPVVEGIVDNQVIEQSLVEARGRLREGINISQPLSESGVFPPMVVQMIEVGEETGNLAEMLDKLANYYEVEVQRTIDGAISLIEPLFIVTLALMVGFIAISVVLPLFEMYAAF